jgi:fumarate reductase flavoprotein subunit
MPQDSQYDVVVIGAGLAGLIAANRAAQLGKRVVVLEKSSEEQYHCNSRYTYGTYHIHYTGVDGDEDMLFDKIMTCTEGFARKDLARSIAKNGRRLMQWLKSENVNLVQLDNYQTNVLAPAWRKGYGLTWKGYGGDMALQRLETNLRDRQGRLLRGTRAAAMKADKGGIVIDTSQGSFSAGAVVVADGGFQASKELIRAHITPDADKLVQRNGGTATGDGLRMAQAMGAAIIGLENFYGHLHAREALKTDRLWPRPYADELASSGIVIDSTGRRVVNEGLGGVWLSNAIARLPDPLDTIVIFDQPIWEGPGRNHVQPPNPLIEEAGGTVHHAGSLAELAGKIGVPAKALEETVAQYNAALEQGALGKLTPPRTEQNKPWPIKTAPFHAIPIAVAITNTMGGIAVDGAARVLDKSDRPIAGLYAAGSTVGGLNGGPHAGYVGGLINSTLGMIAAETIAGRT